MRVGTTTRKPFATSRRPNWDSARTRGRRPAICSGVWSASGRAMTWPSTAPLGLEQQALAVDPLQDRPAHLVGPAGVVLGHQGRGLVVAETFHRHRDARVD